MKSKERNLIVLSGLAAIAGGAATALQHLDVGLAALAFGMLLLITRRFSLVLLVVWSLLALRIGHKTWLDVFFSSLPALCALSLVMAEGMPSLFGKHAGAQRAALLRRMPSLKRKTACWAVGAAGMVWLAGGLYFTLQKIELKQAGVFTEAQVINNEPGSPVPPGGGALAFAFHTPTTAPEGSMTVPSSEYRSMRLGAVVPVTYLPQDPNLFIIGRMTVSRLALSIAAVWLAPSGLFLTFLLLLHPMEERVRRALHLARSGMGTEGVVTGCRPLRKRGKVEGYAVHYCYKPENADRVLEGAGVVRPEGEPTLLGFPIRVYYDPSRPSEAMPLMTLRDFAEFDPDYTPPASSAGTAKVGQGE